MNTVLPALYDYHLFVQQKPKRYRFPCEFHFHGRMYGYPTTCRTQHYSQHRFSHARIRAVELFSRGPLSAYFTSHACDFTGFKILRMNRN